MKRLAFLLLVVSGCFPTRSQEFVCRTTDQCESGRVCEDGFCVVSGTSSVDAPETPNIDSPAATGCDATWPVADRPMFLDPCPIMPGGDLSLMDTGAGGYVLDTGVQANNLTMPGGATMTVASVNSEGNTVIAVQSLTIGAGVTVHVKGTNPLVVVSWSTISIAGTLDGSSVSGATAATDVYGPGAQASTGCTLGTAPTDDGNNGGDGDGGGAGGSFAVAGGAGGNGGDGNDGQGGGIGAAKAMPKLGAGCPGQSGAADNNQGPGLAGSGGGAIQLVAKDMITVGGVVTVGGGGGRGATANRAGGGGGGSGGMIGLEAPMINVPGTLAANGGGGGQGRDQGQTAGIGATGTATATAAAGGAASNQSGGFGGAGGAKATPTGTVGNQGNRTNQTTGDQGGGGGGGGSVGYIVVHGTANVTGTASPTQITR